MPRSCIAASRSRFCSGYSGSLRWWRCSPPPGRSAPDTAAAARAAVHRRHSVRRPSTHDRAVLTVPLWRRDDVVAILELVSHPGQTYLSRDAALVDSYGRGVVAALLGSD